MHPPRYSPLRPLALLAALVLLPALALAGGGSIDPQDIVGWARAELPFAQQRGYTAQVVGTYTSAAAIAEEGIHASPLANGETLRLGKEADPVDPSRAALAFQLGNGDPKTSGSKRSELSFAKNIEMDRVYWAAFQVYVRDWGNEASEGLFGMQMHSGDNSRGLSPSFGLQFNGPRTFRIETRWSASPNPTRRNSRYIKHGDFPIPFARWADIVIRFKHNTSGNGFLQAWMDGQQIVDYKGSLGFNTPGYKDYAKFGLYNWGTFKTPRKVLLRSPTVVLDPTGRKYDVATLRAHIGR